MTDETPSAERILVDVEDGVGTLTLNRPEKLNAFLGDMRDRLGDGLERLAGDDDVRVIVVTGRGRAFCAGADVGYLREMVEEGRIEEARALVEAGRRAVTAIVDAPKPVIGALNGPAAGGGANLALACDVRIASERASIGQTFNRIGLHPDWGGTYFLPRLVGPAVAAELIFTARMVEAEEALELGLFNRVVPHDRLRDEVAEMARTLARKPARPLRMAKEALRRSLASSLSEMLDYEVEAQTECFRSAEAREGTRAFVEKRDADFRAAEAGETAPASGRDGPAGRAASGDDGEGST